MFTFKKNQGKYIEFEGQNKDIAKYATRIRNLVAFYI